jgi:hypothetical protein
VELEETTVDTFQYPVKRIRQIANDVRGT